MTISRSSQAFAGGGVKHRYAEERQANNNEKQIEHRNPMSLAKGWRLSFRPDRIKDRDRNRGAYIRIS